MINIIENIVIILLGTFLSVILIPGIAFVVIFVIDFMKDYYAEKEQSNDTTTRKNRPIK